MRNVTCILLLLSSIYYAHSIESPHDAARQGNLSILRKYRFEAKNLFLPDERGFIPYELAALNANPNKLNSLRKHVEIMLWLKEYKTDKHNYGKASIALVQAGLNALGYYVGKPDGFFGRKTKSAVKSFQKNNGLAQTGKLGPQWLGIFYIDILKDIQFKLTKLNFNTGGIDGIMGEKTRIAILKYRKKYRLKQPEYPYLDALLVSSINYKYSNAEKKRKSSIAITKQIAKSNKVYFVQVGLNSLGYRVGKIDSKLGSKTIDAIKKFQRRYKLLDNGKINTKTMEKMNFLLIKKIQHKLNYLGYNAGNPDGRMGKKTLTSIKKYCANNNIKECWLNASIIISINNNFVTKLNNKAKVKSDRRKTTSKTTSKISTNIKSSHARGRMHFSRKKGRVIGCKIAGRNIPIEWCEPFYPLPKNNHCEATFKLSSATVINLWCK